MDILILIILSLIAGLILFGLPIFIGYKLWRKGRYTKYLVTAMLLGYAYMWYRAFYPEDSFYIEHLERFTGVSFQNGANFKTKYAGFPDIHGDYPACAYLTAPTTSIDKLISSSHAGYAEIDP